MRKLQASFAALSTAPVSTACGSGRARRLPEFEVTGARPLPQAVLREAAAEEVLTIHENNNTRKSDSNSSFSLEFCLIYLVSFRLRLGRVPGPWEGLIEAVIFHQPAQSPDAV